MTFRRFLTWLVEKLFELHLAIAVVLVVKFFLPLTAESYTSVPAFIQGVRDTWHGAMDDAAYVTGSFLQGNYARYALKTYLASLYVVVFYGYVASLYLFTSLLAVMLGPRHHVRNCLGAYLCSLIVFFWRYVHAYDADMIYMATAFMGLGTVVVTVVAFAGERFYHRIGGKDPAPKRRSSRTGRERLELSH